MCNTKIILNKNFYNEQPKKLLEQGEFTVELFKYSTGVEAVKISNSKGFIKVLPYIGMQIWDINFLDESLKMISVFDEPKYTDDFGSTYGCFLLHCGLTAMGNPSPEDTHPQHGELPLGKFEESWLELGEDEKGKYISISGLFHHARAFEVNYKFVSTYKLYEGSTKMDISVSFTNLRKNPMEYYYLCHVNYKPVEKSQLIYSAERKGIKVHCDVPDNLPLEKQIKLREYMDKLTKNPEIQDVIDKESQFYEPEIVFAINYKSDASGNSYTLQKRPDGTSYYVKHNSKKLPYGVRWISRTDHEDAMGMILPATAEHKGYIYCKENKMESYLDYNETMQYDFEVGLLDANETKSVENKISDIMKN